MSAHGGKREWICLQSVMWYVKRLTIRFGKAELVSTLLSESETIRIVSGSGMAGYGSSNTIVTRKRMSRLYVCGDGETAAANGIGLMSPRVTVCAGHEANMVLRLLLGIEEP